MIKTVGEKTPELCETIILSPLVTELNKPNLDHLNAREQGKSVDFIE